MNRYINLIAILISVYSCVNRNKSTFEIENLDENSKVEMKEYFNSHSHALIFTIDQKSACEICVLHILNRLSYLNSDVMHVFIDGLDNDSDVALGFVKLPERIKHLNNMKTDEPFLCIIDSTYFASHYFVPKMEKPQLLERYLKDVMPKIINNKIVEQD
ncbi:hypothetical protein [Alkalitalea saponilacus]|uniref:Uncharacterized protein n=1 Tax=Alkalitalea saponilacus TaxID=889453 RepID=A0A1T5GFF4_9BACT|nr:hypothetical protein [Alkalitalea saponilacus]ASB47954.1 hypothetical protein CDL62_01695 [Alkalitalea saponilacus]SKC07138.1 hypothetical protein SAMN03080601_01842 [Alkalitalea saponilacus]